MIYLVIKKTDDVCADCVSSAVVYATQDKDIAIYQRDINIKSHQKLLKESKEQIKRYEILCNEEKLTPEETNKVTASLCELYLLQDVIGFELIAVEENQHINRKI